MIQVDIPAAFAIGQIAAYLSRNYLRKESELFGNKLSGAFNIYLSCCYAPAGLFLLIGWPSWEAMYVTSWLEQPFDRPLVAGFYVLFAISMILLGNFGFILGHYCYRKNRDRLVVCGVVVGLILTFSPFLMKWGIWMTVGTYAEKIAGKGYSFYDPPFFHGWLFIIGYVTLSTVLFGFWLRSRDKRFEGI